MKDTPGLSRERLATIMRTSPEMLDKVYGKHDDTSFLPLVNAAAKGIWGDDLATAAATATAPPGD